MTKRELIYAVADLCNMPTSQAQTVIDATLDVIRDELKADREVNLINFGKFSVKHRAASKGRNPRTGEEIQLPAHKLPTFTAGKSLKGAVNHENYRTVR